MRVLITDVSDGSLSVIETSSIWVTQNIKAIDSVSGSMIGIWDFNSVITFKDGEDEFYIVLDSVDEANHYILDAFKNGIMDMSPYGFMTFINPDETDTDAISNLSEQLALAWRE